MPICWSKGLIRFQKKRLPADALDDPYAELAGVEDLLPTLKDAWKNEITPMDRVRIVRHPSEYA